MIISLIDDKISPERIEERANLLWTFFRSKSRIKIYLYMLRFKVSTIKTASQYTGVNYPSAYRAFMSLQELGIINEQRRLKNSFSGPPEIIFELIDHAF